MTDKIKRKFTGIVQSVKMQNTAIVKVDRVKIHLRYKKRYTVSKRYPCDTSGVEVALGDKVVFEETRPISKTKRWRVTGKV